MNAIRRDEDTDNIHSIYVDQWDWERVIERSDRTEEYLKETVVKIINALCDTLDTVKEAFPIYNQKLAGYLMLNGYRLMGMEENQKYKGKNVFYFMDSDRIRKSIQIYFGNSK